MTHATDMASGEKETALRKEEPKSVSPAAARPRNISALSAVPVDIQVVLGGTRLPISNVLKLGRGAVVEVDRKVGDPVDIQINHRLVARGEVVIVDDTRLGVTLTEIIGGDSISL